MHSRWSSREIFSAKISNELTNQQDMFYYMIYLITITLCDETRHKEILSFKLNLMLTLSPSKTIGILLSS